MAARGIRVVLVYSLPFLLSRLRQAAIVTRSSNYWATLVQKLDMIILQILPAECRSHFSHHEVVPAELSQKSSYGVITIEVGVAGTEYDPTDVSAPLLVSRLND
jgi:hypothetical protein